MERRMTFDLNPANYDRYRPGYVQELYHEITHFAGLNGTMQALEIGVGTGLATRPILDMGWNVTAVEAGENLAAFVAAKYSDCPNFHVVRSDFEAFEPEECFDLIYSATAFHWIPEETGYPKVLRLLKPGGTVALFWNRPFAANPDDALHQEIRKIYRKYRPSEAEPVEFSRRDSQKILDALERYGFAEIECKLFYRIRALEADEYVGLLSTYSDHQAMGEKALGALQAEVEAAILAHGGVIHIHDTMDLYLARRGS